MRSHTIPSDDGYTAAIDCVDETSWYGILGKFKDASIYQTWAYGAARVGDHNLSHIIVRRDEQIVAAVQTQVVKTPFVRAGIAYVRWGPLWRRHGSTDSVDDFRQIVKAMFHEYVGRRGLYLRIIPNETAHCEKDLRVILEGAGLSWKRDDYRTLHLALSEPLDVIRSRANRTWRRNLQKAEENGLLITEGTDGELFESVYRLYEEMHRRKRFVQGINIDEYRVMQERLPGYFKMHIMVCHSKGQPIAGLIGSAMGTMGIDLIAATGNDGLRLGGSYLLKWRMLEFLKQRGCRVYDLNGINPKKNPGGYQFKSGVCGRNGLDTEYLGMFEACKNPLSRVAVRSGETARACYRKMGASAASALGHVRVRLSGRACERRRRQGHHADPPDHVVAA